MSLQEMAWLTQGPMAAVDLELDVESMEQEATLEDDQDWMPAVALLAPPSNPSEVIEGKRLTPEPKGLSHGAEGLTSGTVGLISRIEGLASGNQVQGSGFKGIGSKSKGLTLKSKGLTPCYNQSPGTNNRLIAHGKSRSCSSLKHGDSLYSLHGDSLAGSDKTLNTMMSKEEFLDFHIGNSLALSQGDVPPLDLSWTQPIERVSSNTKRNKGGTPGKTHHVKGGSHDMTPGDPHDDQKVPPWRSQPSGEILQYAGEEMAQKDNTTAMPKFVSTTFFQTLVFFSLFRIQHHVTTWSS